MPFLCDVHYCTVRVPLCPLQELLLRSSPDVVCHNLMCEKVGVPSLLMPLLLALLVSVLFCTVPSPLSPCSTV